MSARDTESGGIAGLADFLVNLYSVTNGRWARGDRRDRQLRTVLKVSEAIGILWQATDGTEMWNEFGHFHLGLLDAAARQHRIPGQFKRSLVYETRNHAGQGVTHPRQVLVGIEVGKRKAPTVLLSGAQRKKLQRSAGSQSCRHIARRAETFEMWNYWLDSRTGSRFQK